MTDPLQPMDVLFALVLEDGRTWGSVAADWQLTDAEAIFDPTDRAGITGLVLVAVARPPTLPALLWRGSRPRPHLAHAGTSSPSTLTRPHFSWMLRPVWSTVRPPFVAQ